MFDLLRLYLANILRPVFEDLHLTRDETLLSSESHQINREPDQATSEDDADGEEEEIERRVSSPNGTEWNNGQSAKKSGGKTKVSVKSRSTGETRNKRRERKAQSSNLLDSRGPKLIHGVRSWLLMFQIIGQINWIGIPFYLSLVYKALLFVIVVYIYLIDFIRPQMEAHIVDSNYRNPILMFIGALAILTLLMHAIVSIYTNLFKLCPLFKVLTTPRLCFIRKEVQDIVGNKSLFFMVIFHIYQCILMQMLTLPSLNEFFNQFQVGRFILDSFVITVMSYLFNGIVHIDFYIRICFGFWIIAMKQNLEYRFAYLQRLNKIYRLVGLTSTVNPLQPQLQRAKSIPAPLGSYRNLGQQRNISDSCSDVRMRENSFTESNEEANVGCNTTEENRSQMSLDTNATTDPAIINYNKKPRPTTSQSPPPPQKALNKFREKYKLDTMDEIQKNLNTMDDHLEVCRGIENGSLVLISLNAFLTNGALLLIAYHLLTNQGKEFHGVIIILLVANNTLLVLLCYIGDSWISYALASFVQIVEDEYFLQGGNDCDSVKEPSAQSKNSQLTSTAGSVLPLNWSSTRVNENSDAGSETICSLATYSKDQELFLIRKRDVLFCREFLHQFENHLATPWSKLSLKIHLHMLGTFVTLIAAQIIFDREH